MSADQLENGDYAGTLVHEFTHFEEGTKEYADMMDFLQSDDITVDDGKGGRVKLWQRARDSVLSKDYGISEDQLSGILQKVDAGQEISEDEKRVYKTYATELVAHETETVLGNEQFIDKIIAENGTAAEKLVSRIISLDKAFSSMKDKQSRAQAKLIRQAEGLYLKAAEAAGNKQIVKMILAHRPELEEELTRINEEKMQIGEKRYIGLEEFTDRDNKLWRNVAYEDNETKAQITKELHSKMVEEGLIVKVSDEISDTVSESYPNLQSMKKKERLPILKKAIDQLKQNLRDFLNGFKGKNFEFEINGKILEAKLYNVGINEVLEKITQEKAQMLYVSEEIFKNSKYLYSTPDYDGDPNVYRWNYFYTPVQIGEDVVGVRIAIRDIATPKESQIYNWGIKKDTSLDGTGRGENDRISYGISSDVSNNSISHSAEKSTENAKKVSGNEKDLQMSLKKRDADYLSAVERGDMETAQRMVDEADNKDIRFNLKSTNKSVDNFQNKDYNLYTATNEYQREVTHNDKHTFSRSLANKTSGMSDGDHKSFYIYCYDKVYFFEATGYMKGRIEHSKYVNSYRIKERGIDEYSRTWINKDREIASLWAESVQDEQGGHEGDSTVLGGRGRSASNDTLSEDSLERYTSRYTERERQNFATKEEIYRIVKKLREIYELDSVSEKDIRFNLKEKKNDLGDFFADDNDGGPVYKVSGGKVRKVIADNTRMKVYTRAESERS